jgi:ribonuclease Z
VGPPRPGRKVVISGDTAPCDIVKLAAHQADLLIHEATFLDEESERALQTGHSTARQAAELARDAEVRMLALTHVSTRYAGHEIRDEARTVFANTELPRDFDTIEIPFPEKGEPELQRWDPERAGSAPPA